MVELLPTTIEHVHGGRRLRVAHLQPGARQRPGAAVDGATSPVVLLHGYPETLQLWHAVAPGLARRRTVTAFDWPGMGASEEWPGGATPRHKAAQLVELLDAWGYERATLVGFDMGGQPALACAIHHPDRVDRVVVANSLVFGDLQTSWEIRLLRKYGWNRWILRHLPGRVFARCERTFLPRSTRLDPLLRRDFRDAFQQAAVRAFISKMCAGYQGTLERLATQYPDIRCPVLALWGARDSHFPPLHAMQLAATIPGASLTILPDAWHWMPLHHPDAMIAAIEAHLDAPEATDAYSTM